MSAADDYLTELADCLLARGVDNQQVKNLLAERARDPDAWRPWEYTRCTALWPVVERMQGDGWQPCGHWLAFRYFMRPVGSAT